MTQNWPERVFRGLDTVVGSRAGTGLRQVWGGLVLGLALGKRGRQSRHDVEAGGLLVTQGQLSGDAAGPPCSTDSCRGLLRGSGLLRCTSLLLRFRHRMGSHGCLPPRLENPRGARPAPTTPPPPAIPKADVPGLPHRCLSNCVLSAPLQGLGGDVGVTATHTDAASHRDQTAARAGPGRWPPARPGRSGHRSRATT